MQLNIQQMKTIGKLFYGVFLKQQVNLPKLAYSVASQ